MVMELSKIEQVELRRAWPNEAQDFTPWLAENISELGEALGIDLEFERREVPVGSYSLDILAIEPNSNRKVIIENQLEPTNNVHLGQLLTYASGLNAKVVVWLAREFRDEHRQALDWLNEQTTSETEFFGVEVELWKIDGSRPAPHFRLVSTPNEWSKVNRAGASGEDTGRPSARRERYGTFFQTLIDTLRERHGFTNARKAFPQNWYFFATGYRPFQYGANFTKDKTARVEVYIDEGEADMNLALFEALEEEKVAIESDFGKTLDWQRLEGKRACRIAMTRPGSIDETETKLEEINSWMVSNLLKFKEVFSPHFRELS